VISRRTAIGSSEAAVLGLLGRSLLGQERRESERKPLVYVYCVAPAK
jgi:hypothetical protein